MTTPPIDLKKVGQLFDETITLIRDGTPDIAALEAEAIAWLKDERYSAMRKVEAQYYKLAQSLHAPLLQPQWVDPSEKLSILSREVPLVLRPYIQLFCDNLVTLLKDCGFQATGMTGICSPQIFLEIQFPLRARVTEHPVFPKILHVEDEFSGGESKERDGFSASSFGRLLIGACSENVEDQGDNDSLGET